MASPRRESLAARMAPPAKPAGPATSAKAVLDSSFTAPKDGEEYTKRLTIDLTDAQHKKLKMQGIERDKKMAQMVRDWIDSL